MLLDLCLAEKTDEETHDRHLHIPYEHTGCLSEAYRQDVLDLRTVEEIVPFDLKS